MMYYVYSLKCRDGWYVGCTDDLKERLERHKNGRVPATASRLPITLDFYVAIPDKYKAFAFEKYEIGFGPSIYQEALIAWWGGRVVEGNGLENRHTGNRIVSSNLTPTAIGVYCTYERP